MHMYNSKVGSVYLEERAQACADESVPVPVCVCVQEKALQEAQLTISQLDAAVATLHQQLSRCLSRAHISAHTCTFRTL